MTTFQLIFDGELNDRSKFIFIADKVANILELQPEFLGSYFSGTPCTIYESKDFNIIRKKQDALEKLDIYCDIKPVEKQKVEPFKEEHISYKSTHIDPLEALETDSKKEFDLEEINSQIESLELSDLEDDKNSQANGRREPYFDMRSDINDKPLDLDPFDPDFDPFKN